MRAAQVTQYCVLSSTPLNSVVGCSAGTATHSPPFITSSKATGSSSRRSTQQKVRLRLLAASTAAVVEFAASVAFHQSASARVVTAKRVDSTELLMRSP